MSQHIVRSIALLACLFLSPGCNRSDAPNKSGLEEKEPETAASLEQQKKTIRIAVGGMITPKAGFGYYRQYLDYVGENLGMHVDFVDRENYAEINDLVRRGSVDVAFVCGGPYVDGHDAFGMELLVAPQAYGLQVYYSYIIVGKTSTVNTFEELRGRSFAFTDPLSNSGALVPTYMLARKHESPKSFFKKVIFTRAHDKSIKAVALGIVDGAAVDSLIWEYENRTSPEFTSRTKIILKSPPYGIPPVVVRPGLDPELKERIRRVFLNTNKDARGREILKGMMIDKFLPIDDAAYASIRDMKVWIEKQKKIGKE